MGSPPEPPPEAPQLSYFVATLAHAQRINAANPHNITTINQLLDERAASTPDLPAVGMAIPSADNSAWQSAVYSEYATRRAAPPRANNGCSFPGLAQRLHHAGALSRRLADRPRRILHRRAPANRRNTCPELAAASNDISGAGADRVHRAADKVGVFPSSQELRLNPHSPQSTPRAISCLLDTTACTHLFHSSPLAAPLGASCTTLFLPPLPPSSAAPPYPTPPTITASTTAYVHHTSGTSSGVPTAIPHSHAAATSRLPQLPPASAFSTTPLYHGGTADLLRSLMASGMLWLYPPSVPFTSQNILKALEAAEAAAPPPTLFTAVPYVLELCATDEAAVQRLAAMEMVGVGGAPLRAEIGTELVQRGVKLVSRFGSSECGCTLPPPNPAQPTLTVI